jgi:hypothetical protein
VRTLRPEGFDGADYASEGPIRGTIAQILEFKWKTRD